jgi:uncharacterized protein YjbI with pentapeptide repeats
LAFLRISGTTLQAIKGSKDMSQNGNPEAPEWIFQNIAEASKMAKSISFIYLSLLCYTIITVGTITDRQLLLNKSILLPILQVNLPVQVFAFIAPTAIIVVFAYMQLYIARIKGLHLQLIANYGAIPKRRFYPWIYNISNDPEPGFYGWGQRFFVQFTQWALIFIALVMVINIPLKTKHDILLYYNLALLILSEYPLLNLINDRYYGFDSSSGKSKSKFRIYFANPGLTVVIIAFLVLLTMAIFSTFTNILGIEAPIDVLRKSYNLNYQTISTRPDFSFEGSYWLYLDNIDMSYSKLIYSDIRMTKLEGANLKGVDARHANFAGCKLLQANLDGAQFNSAILDSANLDFASAIKCDFTDAKIRYAQFVRIVATGAIFKRARIENSLFTEASLVSTNFEGTRLSECDFRGANLSYANFQNVDLSNTDISRAIFVGANLKDVNYIDLEHFLTVASLYLAEVDPYLKEQILRKKPHLFDPFEQPKSGTK